MAVARGGLRHLALVVRIGAVEMPAISTAPPMTFMHEGSQYVVVPVAGHAHLGSLVALRLP